MDSKFSAMKKQSHDYWDRLDEEFAKAKKSKMQVTCKCGSTRTVRINGKTSDLCMVIVDHLHLEHDGYVPNDLGIGGGDYLDFEFCADCGHIQGFQYLSDNTIKQAIKEA